MTYLQRTLMNTLKEASDMFGVVLITGPRQVGKTTLLQAAEASSDEKRHYVTLDDLEQRALAQTDPALFLQVHPPPVIIDEVQYAPHLFGAIKMAVDRSKKPGQFWLTGSQKFHLMQGISESLAGRVAILDLLGFSQAERQGRSGVPFLPTPEWIETVESPVKTGLSQLYHRIWLGDFPKLVTGHEAMRETFYRSYIQTYIQRDVSALVRVVDALAFARFLRVAAARTGQLVNYADMARDADVDQKTIKKWLSILETSGLVYLLYPYHANITKRLIKTPKLYFLDTGLCSYLTQWSTPESLESGAMTGSILETWMLGEILKSYWHNGKAANFYFYRDHEQVEVDLLISRDNYLYPVEFKKSASPSLSAIKSFSALSHLDCPMGTAGVVCLKETPVPLSREVWAIPAGYL